MSDLDPFAGNLEQWLSYLSTDQPWHTEAENLRNRAEFREASLAVKTAIDLAERVSISQAPPSWASRLVAQWCLDEASVATFNYDLLVERVVSRLGRVGTWADLYGISLTERLPPGTHLMFATSEPTGKTCRLFKMHGSTNWAYGGLDAPSTDRIVLKEQSAHWPQAGSPSPPSIRSGRDESVFDDLLPLIVPPTGTKAPYYGNSSLRAQWRKAFQALAAATQVTIIGYSFPASDLVSRHFISTARLTCPVTIVNRSCDASREFAALAPGVSILDVNGTDAVVKYAESVCADYVEWSTWRLGDQFVPHLWVNGIEDVSLAALVRARGLTYDQTAVQTLLQDKIDGRWPGMRSAIPTDRHNYRYDGHNQVFFAYGGEN